MQKAEICCGLPWLSSKPERLIFGELSFACVYAVGPIGGRPLRLGWARQLKDRMSALQLGNPKELILHECIWTAGDMLAIRIFNDVEATFDKAKRRLFGDWFDVTPEFAQQAIRLASDKLTVQTFSHGDMLQKVRTIRKNRIDAAVKAVGTGITPEVTPSTASQHFRNHPPQKIGHAADMPESTKMTPNGHP